MTPAETEPLLRIDRVSKDFGGLCAVNRVSLEVREGEIVGLIGPNGAGKTTLFNMIAGAIRPSSGRVLFKGEDVTRLGAHQRCKRGIARTFQIVRPFPDLTVLENVAVGRVYGRDAVHRRRLAESDAAGELARVGLAGQATVEARHLTLVNRKRLELARALASRPALLLLDELLAGLNPTEVLEAMDLIRAIRADGISVIMVEHVVKAIFGISDRVVVMSAGERIAEGTPAEIAGNERVIDAYLGASHAA
jgi:branched-chain amino acid transport system ATP-binding protein